MGKIMKHLVLRLPALVALLSAFCTGCSESEEGMLWDFVSPSVCFYVTDMRTGENLLDPDGVRTILGNAITVTYRGKTYEMSVGESACPLPGTRDLPSRPLALRLEKQDDLGNGFGWHLAFGEFNPNSGLHGETFVIDWGDGTQDEVKFDLYIEWRSPKDPRIHSPLSFNGEDRGEGYYEAWVIRLGKEGREEPGAE